MSQINITDFPEEIIEKIFFDVHNTGGSLKTLTEVCKRFNRVIFSRTKFMSKFSAIWNCNQTSVKPLLASTRKYQQIKIVNSDDVMSDDLMQFLKKQNNSLISLVVISCEVGISELMKIFKAVNNIREIRIRYARVYGDKLPKPLNLLMLNKITLINIEGHGATYLLNLFEDATNVEDFEINNARWGLDEDEVFYLELPKILSKFTKLKRFADFFFINPLFQDGWLDETITYQLEELSLVFNATSDANFKSNLSFNDEIINYIKKHQHSLKKLNLGGFMITKEIIECAFSIDQLTELILRNWKFDSESRPNIMNYSIKKLTFENKLNNADEDVRFMLSNCKHVQEISFYSMHITKEVSSVLAGQKNIEKLNFISCDIFPMTYPSVKSMELQGIRNHFNDMIKVMRVNRQLKYLLLPDKLQTHQRYKTAMKTLELDNLQIYPVCEQCVKKSKKF